MKTRAFTLIELLVVIAIIALLMAILIPTLRLAKQQAGTSVCLSNTKNLALGWYMYMGDNALVKRPSDHYRITERTIKAL